MRIPIVDENDQIIGYKDREDRNPEEITRITALWLNNEKGEFLLAQRAKNKKFHPGLWGPAVAGTVEEGETYETNIVKEAEEEIGIKNLQPIIGPKIRRNTVHSYFVQWFTATINSLYPFVKQDAEVEDIKWFSKEEFLHAYKQHPEVFLPSVKDALELFLNNNANQG